MPPSYQAALIRRRNLPHLDVPGATFFITGCLEGSIPARGLLDLQKYRIELESRRRPADMTEDQWDDHCWKLGFVRLETYLDGNEGTNWLSDACQAQLVVDSLRFFAGERYELFTYVIMQSHFHWLFRPLPAWVASLPMTMPIRSPRERIMYSVRRYSARQCNLLLGRHGTYWQHESHDHCVRDTEEFERIICYIENNPVKAGLVKSPNDWLFSSASLRKRLGLPFGSPLPKLG